MPSTVDLPGVRMLRCGTCEAPFVLGDFDPDAAYRCARCDRSLTQPSGSFDTLRDVKDPTYLYSSPARSEPPPAEPTGRMGRYELYEVLGRGGMGVVYRARDPELGRDVALKVLIAAEHAGDSQLDRFLREARAAAQLNHPNVVRVLDIQRDGQQAFFTMDLVRGPSLADLVDELGCRPIREAVRIVAEVGRALHEAHKHDLLHRDVKPGNVLLTMDGTPRLTDFGLVSASGDVDTRITRTGQVLGTPAYMAPEQATHEADALTPAADQYALGAVLYELLVGCPPFDGTAMEVLLKLVSEPPRSVRELRPEVPRDLQVVLQRAMDMDPERRYPSVLHFVEDLERWRRGDPIHARPASAAYRLRLWAVRRRRLLAAVGMALAMAAATVLLAQQVAIWRLQRQVEAREAAALKRWEQTRDRMALLASDGREDELLEAFADFVQEPLHRGTRAVATAWRERAESLLAEGDHERAVDAFGAAYVAGMDEGEQVAALRGLARAFDERWRFDALQVVASNLVARGEEDEQTRDWLARSALERDDLGGALSWMSDDDPRRSMVMALSNARPLTEVTGTFFVGPERRSLIDVDPDGQVRQLGLSPGLPLLSTYTLDEPLGRRVRMASSDPLVVVTQDGELTGTASVFVPDGDRLSPTVRWPEALILAALDLPQGVLVGVGPYARRLVRVDRRTGEVDAPAPEVNRSASDVMSLAAGDLDGDGDLEIAVGSGPWGSYDVRVYDSDWTPRARRKIGVPQEMRIVDGHLFVAEPDAYPSAQAFPSDQPYGEPSSVLVMELGRDGLEVVHRLHNPVPHDGRGTALAGLEIGDVDGDGLLDVAARSNDGRHGAHLLVWPGLADGGWGEALAIPDVEVFASADVDGDGDLELFVDLLRDDGRARWVLGSGTASLPPRAEDVTPGLQVPDTRDAVASRRWNLAEELVRMGLLAAAAEAIEDVASSTTDALMVGPAQLRAGRLWEAAGADARAAERYQLAAADPAVREEALDAATLAFERIHRFAEANDLAGTRDTPTARSVRERVGPLLHETGVWEAAGPDLVEQLELLDAVGLQWGSAEGVLWADVLADDGPLVSRRFRWDGRRITLEAELDLERMEWASGLQLSLHRGRQDVLVFAQAWGGGNVLEHELGCATSAHQVPLSRREEVAGPSMPRRLTLWVDVAPAVGRMRCRITDGDDVVVDTSARISGGLEDGEWTLELRPTGHAGLSIPVLARAGLRSLRLSGSALEVLPRGDVPELNDALIRGRPEQAGSLEASGDVQRVWRLAALADAGSWDAARVALQEVLAEPSEAQRREILHLLRSRSVVFTPLLADVTGPDFVSWFDEAWTGALYAHPDDPEVTRALTTQLGGIERAPTRPVSIVAETQRVVLLQARAQAWMREGEVGASRRDLMAAELALEAVWDGLDQQQKGDVGRRLAATHRALAVHEALADRPEAALRHGRQSVRWAPSWDVGLDGLRATGALDDVVAALSAEGRPTP